MRQKMQREIEISALLENRDEAAFRSLYERYAPSLYGVIKRFTADTQLANKILLLSIIEIWQTLDAYNSADKRLLTWMISVTTKQCGALLNIPAHELPYRLLGAKGNYGNN